MAVAMPSLAPATPGVTNTGSDYIVNNGVLNFDLNYTQGKITSILYDGQQMVGTKGLYYDIQGSPGIFLGSGENYSVRTGSNFVDISAEHPATASEPLDVTWHWILQDGSPGFSTYLTYNHTTAMADYASSENRLGAEFFNSNLFHYNSIADNFWGYQAAGNADRSDGNFITAETSNMQGIPSEYIKNYETKYDWRTTYQNSDVIGLVTAANTSQSTRPASGTDYGVWAVYGARAYESWNAGPTHPQTPVADGASIIPSPAASHFGGPGLIYTGNMEKSFGPFFTYFNTGANINTMRADAEQYTTQNPSSSYDLNTFYDSINLPYYTTSAQRGNVTGSIRTGDGASMAGATIILSTFDPNAYATDPLSQEYQRRAAGYDYWVTPNANGTFNITGMIPGTYRVTVIDPGDYREGTFDSFTVSANGTTNVGNLTWQPDVSGQGVFQIGKFDRTAAEFRDGTHYNNWIDTFNLTKEFPKGVNYTVNPANPFNDTKNWSQNWPLDQINGSLDFFNVNFNLASAPAANATVTVTLAIADQEYINDFAVLVGSNRVDASFDHTNDYAPAVVRSGDTTSRVLYRKLTFPASWLHSGSNTVTFHIVGGDMQYDAVRMDIQNPGTFSQSIWNGGTGNWSDGAQWGTQPYGFTAINKGQATINGVTNPNYPNDTSTTFADGAMPIAPINSAGSQLYYDAFINGGAITLNTSPTVQKLSLLSGTLNAGLGSPTLTANDVVTLAGGTFTGPATINALTTTTVNFNNTISGGAKVVSNGEVTWDDGATVTVTGSGSSWTTPGLSFGANQADTLMITSGGSVSTGSGVLNVAANGVVNIDATSSLLTSGITNAGSFFSQGTVNIGAGAFTNSGNASINGGLSGNGGVINNGGVLQLSGVNNYAGATTINGGLVAFASAGSIGGSGASVMVGPGGAVGNGGGITDSAFLSRLSPASTGALALGPGDATTNLDFTSGALVPFAGMAIGAVGNVSYSGTYTPAGGIYRLGGGGNLSYQPAISGASSVLIGNYGGSGAVALNDLNSYTGTTKIRGGVLVVDTLANGGIAGPIGMSSNAPANLVIDGGTLQFVGSGAASTDRLITITANGATFDASGIGSIQFINTGSASVSGVGSRMLTLTGTGGGNIFNMSLSDPAAGLLSLTKSGTGSWGLGGTLSYSGDTSVLNGLLALMPGAVLPSGAGRGNLNVGVNGLMELNGVSLNINGLNDGPAGPITATNSNGWATPNGPGGGTLDNAGATANLTIGNGDAGGLFSGVIGGSVNLTKVGAGTQILSGDNTYIGSTTISGGTLQIGIGGTPSSLGPGDGGFRGMLGTGNVINNGTLVFNRGYLTTSTNVISGSGMLKQIANAELVLGTANTYTGPTLIGGGIANIGLGGPNDGTGLAYSGDCSLNAGVLANGGLPSSIGASSNAAANLILDGGTLFYTGGGASTDRLFTVTQNGGAIYANGGLNFTSTGSIAMTGSGDRTLSLEGETTQNSVFGPSVGDPAGGRTFLTKDRSNTWILGASSVLTYSGDTDMDMGKLSMGAVNQLPYGFGRGNVVFATSTDFSSQFDPVLELNGFDLNINGLSGALAGYGSVDNSVGVHTFTLGNNNATAEFLGAITGGINLVKNGSGVQTLDGTNTYSGSTTVNGGALIFSATSTIGGNGGKNVNINNGGVLGVAVVSQSVLARIASTSSGCLALTAACANNLDFSLETGANLPNLSLGAIGSQTFSGTITPYGGMYNLGGGGGTLTMQTSLTGGGNSLVVGFMANPTIAGAVVLSVADSYGGTTTINSGMLEFGSLAAIGGSGPSVTPSSNSAGVAALYAMDQTFLNRLTSSSMGVVALGASSANNLDESAAGANLAGVSIGAIGSVSFTGTLTPNGTTYRLGGGGGALTLPNANALTGVRSLVVGGNVGGGVVALTANNTYTGATTIGLNSTLKAIVVNGGSPSGMGQSSNAATNLIIDGGTFAPTGTTDRLFSLTSNGGAIDQSGGASFTNSGSIALQAGVNTTLTLTGSNTGHEDFAPALADKGGGFITSVIKTGTGKWTFNVTNDKTYSGDTDVLAGTLETLAGSAYSAFSNMVVSSGAFLEFHANSQTINGLSGAGTVNNSFGTTQSFTMGQHNGGGDFSGVIAGGGTFNVTKTGSGTQIFSGANTYTGNTTVSGGVLQIGDGGTGGSFGNGVVLINSPGKVAFDVNGPITVANNMISNGSVVLNGSGTVTLTGTNTYSGGTTINAGALAIPTTSALPFADAVVDNSLLSIQAGTSGTPVVSGNLSGSGALTVGASGAPAYLRLNSNSGASTLGALNIAAGSTLDITSNSLTINYTTDPASLIHGYLHNGYSSGSWQGTGIVSSTVAGQVAANKGTVNGVWSIGYADGNSDGNSVAAPGQLIIRPALGADATLDNKVDFNDLLVLAQNLGSTSADWMHADFNYDSVVDFNDLLILAQNLNTTNGTTPLAGQLPASFEAQWNLALAEVRAGGSVPEPAGCALLLSGAAGILLRRRRRGVGRSRGWAVQGSNL